MPSPVHIVFLIDLLRGIGGAETVVLELVRHLPRDRFRCTVVTLNPDILPEIRARCECPIVVFPLTRTWDWNALKTGLRLARWMRRENVRIAHCFFQSSDLWGAPFAKLGAGVKIISSHRDMGFRLTFKHLWGYRLLAPIFDQVHAVANAVGERCHRNLWLPARRIRTVYNGVHPPPAAAFDGRPPAQRIFITANIRRIKGLDVLIRALPLIRKEFPAVEATFAGAFQEPAYLDELHQLMEHLDVATACRFAGPLSKPDILYGLRQSDAFCLPSHSEGISNALLEAMSVGLPCVATNVGGNPEILEDGVSGWLVPPGDHKALAQRFVELFRDPAAAQSIGAAARARVAAHFTVEAMVKQVAGCYDELLATAGSDRTAS